MHRQTAGNAVKQCLEAVPPRLRIAVAGLRAPGGAQGVVQPGAELPALGERADPVERGQQRRVLMFDVALDPGDELTHEYVEFVDLGEGAVGAVRAAGASCCAPEASSALSHSRMNAVMLRFRA